MPALAVLVPVLGRPHRIVPFLQSLAAATPGRYRVVFIADSHDTPTIGAIEKAHATPLIVDGNYAHKINKGVHATSEQLLFLGADDLHFHPGWLEAAKAKLTPGIGVVGTNDLCNGRVIAGEHSTHSLVTRAYTELGTIDDPTRLLHEGYPHEFVDDEFVQTAMYRGAYAHAHDSVVEHLHPQVGKAPMDDLYAAQRQRMRHGARIYRRRRHLWTQPLSSLPTETVPGSN